MMPAPAAPTSGRSRQDAGKAVLQGVLAEGSEVQHAVIRRHGTQALVLLDAKAIRHCFIANAANYRQAAARKRMR